MEKIIRFLSGDLPIGILGFLAILAAILFVYAYVVLYSPVVNKKKFRTFTIALIGFLVFTYVIARLARPPIPETVRIAILPLEFRHDGRPLSAEDSLYVGTGWAVAEIATRAGELQAPKHVIFLRPEWTTEIWSVDSAGEISPSDPRRTLASARLVRLDYLAFGSFDFSNDGLDLSIEIQHLPDRASVGRVSRRIDRKADAYVDGATEAGLEVTRQLMDAEGLSFRPEASGVEIYRTGVAPLYFKGCEMFARRQWSPALAAFQEALKKDSSSLLGWYGSGLAYGELMIRTTDEKQRPMLQRRFEYHLKIAGQRQSDFQPAYTALVRYFMLTRPEPRYLDAELAMIAANELYDRDYRLYYLLSFMQKARWESFRLYTKEQVLQKALEINPAGFDAHLAIGQYYIQHSRPHDYQSEQALRHFDVAHTLRPNDLDAIRGLVMAYDYMGYYDKAIALLEPTLKNHKDNAELHYSLGIVRYHAAAMHRVKKEMNAEARELSLAEASFLRAVELKNHGYARLYLGKIYDSQNKRNQAIEQFRLCMRILDKEDPYREEARKKLREYFPDVE